MQSSRCTVYLRTPPAPVIVTIMDIKDYIRVLLFSYCTTITGWGVLLKCTGIVPKNVPAQNTGVEP